MNSKAQGNTSPTLSGDRPKHTAGPWECIETEFGTYQTGEVAFVVSSKNEQMVSSVANCRLISAAPDLLACCERALNQSARVHPDFLEQLQAAIAKATLPN